MTFFIFVIYPLREAGEIRGIHTLIVAKPVSNLDTLLQPLKTYNQTRLDSPALLLEMMLLRVERRLELAARRRPAAAAEYPGGGGGEHAHQRLERVQLRRHRLRPRYVALLPVQRVQHSELNAN